MPRGWFPALELGLVPGSPSLASALTGLEGPQSFPPPHATYLGTSFICSMERHRALMPASRMQATTMRKKRMKAEATRATPSQVLSLLGERVA